jgi:hypothetical protein
MRQRRRLLEAADLKHGAARWAQTFHVGFHASFNTLSVRYFRRTEPEGIGRAGLLLLGSCLEGLSARYGAQAKAGNQKSLSNPTKGEMIDVHEGELLDSERFRMFNNKSRRPWFREPPRNLTDWFNSGFQI